MTLYSSARRDSFLCQKRGTSVFFKQEKLLKNVFFSNFQHFPGFFFKQKFSAFLKTQQENPLKTTGKLAKIWKFFKNNRKIRVTLYIF